MWKTLIRPAMIFIPFLLGALFPEAHVLNKPPINLVRWALFTLLFLSCLPLEIRELRPRREHWILLGANIILGIVPYALMKWLLPERPELALIAFFVGITPTATAAPVVMSFLHGNMGFTLTGFVLSDVGISLALLVLLPLTTGEFTASFMGSVAWTLGFVIALPFLLSVIVRKLCPKAPLFASKLKTFSFGLWSVNLFCLAAVARQYFVDHPELPGSMVAWTIGISLGYCAVNFALGSMIARKEYRQECSQLLGQKNTTFTMFLALEYGGPLIALGPIFYILWHNLWNAWQIYQFDRRQQRRNG